MSYCFSWARSEAHENMAPVARRRVDPNNAMQQQGVQSIPLEVHSPRARSTARPSQPPRRPSSSKLSLRGQDVLRGAYIGLVFAFCISLWVIWSKHTRCDLEPAIKAYVDGAVHRAISRALRDPVGRRDFALLADGAILLPELTEVAASRGMLRARDRGTRPEVALDDDMHIGNCWSIPGAGGQLGFRLATMIRPTHVSIDHIPSEIAADISRAPREMALWGGVDGPYEDILRNFTESRCVNPPNLHGRSAPFVTHGYNFTLLAHFEYDIRSPVHVQTFGLQPYIVDSDVVFGVVVLEILNNWGGKSTCLYRVRVHGDVADFPL